MRLTYKDKYGHWCSDGSKASLQLGNPRENWPSILWGDAVDKLAAYEDTGYSPIEIKSLAGEWNAMRSVVDSYRAAEEQGLLVRLPCKVGDMAYYLRGTTIYGDTVERIIIDGLNNQIVLNANRAYLFCDVGRKLFFTYAEAEAALNGR